MLILRHIEPTYVLILYISVSFVLSQLQLTLICLRPASDTPGIAVSPHIFPRYGNTLEIYHSPALLQLLQHFSPLDPGEIPAPEIRTYKSITPNAYSNFVLPLDSRDQNSPSDTASSVRTQVFRSDWNRGSRSRGRRGTSRPD